MDFFEWLKSLDMDLEISNHAWSDAGVSITIQSSKYTILMPISLGAWTPARDHGKNISEALKNLIQTLIQHKSLYLVKHKYIPVPLDLKFPYGKEFPAKLATQSFEVDM